MTDVYMVARGMFPFRVAGDKNFFLDLLTGAVLPDGIDLTVLSFTGRSGYTTQLSEHVWLREMSRPFHHHEYQRYSGRSGDVRHFHHQHALPLEYAERAACLCAASLMMTRLAAGPPLAVHYLDNFGPLMDVASRNVRAHLAVSSSRPVGWPYGALRSVFLRTTLGRLDRIGASSRAARDAFVVAGLPAARVQVQRLGVRIPPIVPGAAAKRHASTALWTGKLPHGGLTQFDAALAAANLLATGSKWNFRFLFKPEAWRDQFAHLASARIEIVQSQVSFIEELHLADLLISPLTHGSPLVPPLSWLEAMSMGVPVVTSPVVGIEELIVDGWDGFVQRESESFTETVRRALDADVVTVGQRARERIVSSFRIDQALDDLVGLWTQH